MVRRLAYVMVACVAVAFSAGVRAQAAQGYLAAGTTLLAGPSPDYPQIAFLPYQTWVSVQGCTAGWQWCDVIAGPNRGWLPGDYILYPYQGTPVMLPSYGARIGIPIVTFVIGSYWGAHYHNRPFYRNRNYWYRRPIVIGRPPAPPHRPPNGWGRPPPRPGNGHRPPGNIGNRPPHGGSQRPPGNGHRPQPGGSHRPPPNTGNRPTPGNRPPSGQRPPTNAGSQPPAHGNRPPPGTGNRPTGGKHPSRNRRPPASSGGGD